MGIWHGVVVRRVGEPYIGRLVRKRVLCGVGSFDLASGGADQAESAEPDVTYAPPAATK